MTMTRWPLRALALFAIGIWIVSILQWPIMQISVEQVLSTQVSRVDEFSPLTDGQKNLLQDGADSTKYLYQFEKASHLRMLQISNYGLIGLATLLLIASFLPLSKADIANLRLCIAPAIIFALLVGFAIFYQNFGFIFIIFGPFGFIPLFLWIGLYAPLLYIPGAHYSGDSNLPFLSVPILLFYSFIVAALHAAAISARSRMRIAGLSLLITLGSINFLLACLYYANGGRGN